jgi:hypothetical protein
MIIEDNNMERYPVEVGVPQASPVSPILCVIFTSGQIKWVEESVSRAKGLFFVHNLGWVATVSNVNHVIKILER